MSKEGLTGAKAGDEVVLTDVNRKAPWRARIASVGRKYATIGSRKFELGTGVVADAWRHTQAYTPTQWARRELESDLDAATRILVERSRGRFDAVSDDELRDAARMLRELAAKFGVGR